MAGRSGDRSLTWLPIAGAAVIALIGVIVVVSVGSGSNRQVGLRTDGNGALTCPASYAYHPRVSGTPARSAVPFEPSGVDGTSHLVPDAKPQHVTVCRYAGGTAVDDRESTVRLAGHRVVTGEVAAMAKSLSTAPKASKKAALPRCTGTPLGVGYLVGFVYPTGVEWLDLPGTGCKTTTNGQYSTTSSYAAQVAGAYSTGRWG